MFARFFRSPSLRGRGLKSYFIPCRVGVRLVALFTRAWIEIEGLTVSAPSQPASPSLRGRGLKYCTGIMQLWFCRSPSLRGRGLKYRTSLILEHIRRGRPLYEGVDWNSLSEVIAAREVTSPSLRGRGLKCLALCCVTFRCYSRPLCEGVDWNCPLARWVPSGRTSPSLRGRGLKYVSSSFSLAHSSVALFARAWIEICKRVWEPRTAYSRPLCEGVDWNIQIISTNLRYEGRPLCEGVDWNPPL